MRQRQMTNFRENTFVWLLLLYFSIIGLVLLIGRFLFWDNIIQVIEYFFSPDRYLEYNGVVYIERLAPAFIILHIGLALTGWIFLFSKPWLAKKGIVIIDQKDQTRSNLFIISSLFALYLFGVFNIPEVIIGVRLPIFEEDSLFEYATAVSYIISGFLFFLTILNIRKDAQTRKKNAITIFFVFLIVISILIAGEEISWGQRIFGWETPERYSFLNKQEETNLHNLMGDLGKENFEFCTGIIISTLVFGVWLHTKQAQKKEAYLIIPPTELFITAILMLGSSGYNEELFEEMTALFMLLYSVWIWYKWRVRIRNRKTADPIY